jgi:peptidyl-prolyl cis-trans isomerase SurA
MRQTKSLLLIIALLATVALCYGQAHAGIMLDRVVAIVNDEAITWGELYRAMEFELSKEMQSLSVDEKKTIFEENEHLFLEKMINQKLQLQAAKRHYIGVSQAEVDAAVAGIKKKFSMDDTQFIRALQADGFTLEEYRKRISEQLIISKLVDVAVKGQISITDEDLKGIPEGDAFYKLRQIFFKEGAGAQAKADRAMAELKAGADFASLARKYSEDPLASAGGDLGLVQKSKMAGKFAEALEGLSPGEFTQPFRTENGVHILKLEEIRGVREVLTEERLEDAYDSWLKGLRERSFIEVRL